MAVYDYVVVGSGCSGAMAAQTLVEAGAKVCMLDVGVTNDQYDSLVPNKNYLEIRRTDPKQYKYLIGENGEGINWGKISKGAQVTPGRHHMTDLVDKYLPIKAANFSPMESLGYGGLGIGWGLQCWEFSTSDQQRAGLNSAKLPAAYEIVSKRIGLSATKDAAAAYTLGQLQSFQPSPKADRNHSLIYKKYMYRQRYFRKHGVFLGRTPLALITKDLPGRKAYSYRDMDFYDDNNLSAWRPWITINELKARTNFKYLGSHLVLSFKETGKLVEIHCLETDSNQVVTILARKLILASSALGSARIVLRSLGSENSRLPILSNPHAYIPALQPAMLGKAAESRKLGFGQLSLFIDTPATNQTMSIATTYSYQSLMMFRIIQQLPLNFADARIVLRYLMPALILMIAQHPDAPAHTKYLKLIKDAGSPTGDKLQVNYSLSDKTEQLWDKQEKLIMATMRKLNVYGLKRVHPPHGSAIHYAGTLPFSKRSEPMKLQPSGHLHGTKNIYVADSSGFNYLPAPGLTFTMMANAHLVAESAMNNE